MEFSLLDDGRTLSLTSDELTIPAAGRIRISEAALDRALGWELKPEGLCRREGEADVCVPVRDRETLVLDGGIDLEGLARTLGRPIVIDTDEGVAALGTSARSQATRMATLEAPDFELPDLAGRMHTLSEHRGKKVLLIAYASW